MQASDLHIVILAAGASTRIRTGGPKALLDLCGQPMLEHLLETAEAIPAAGRHLVLGPPHQEAIEAWLQKSGRSQWQVSTQPEALGTGDAVRAALPQLPEQGQVMILVGDTPLLRRQTLEDMLQAPGGAMLTAQFADPTGYGRVVWDDTEGLQAIVEQADTDERTAVIQEVNAGIYVLDLAQVRRAIAGLQAQNAQGEFYLTDAVVEVMRATGGSLVRLEQHPEEMLGINTLAQLAEASALLRDRILYEHMSRGVIVVDPATTYIETGVEIGPGTQILPFTVLRHGVRIGSRCAVGPFAHLRGDSALADGAEIGNFVEGKNAEMGPGAKAKHLTYLGDVSVGARANIGCGTITANYDGKAKHRTHIGERAFIGSGTVLVAPVRVGDRAMTGAGAVVVRGRDVPDDATVVGVPARPLRAPSPSE